MQQNQQSNVVDYSSTYTACVEREQPTDSWGLRVDGGSDLDEPIVVKQVRRKGPASKAGVKEGDLLSFIDNEPTDGLTRQQLADILAMPRLTIHLKLTRQVPGVQSAGFHDDVNNNERRRQRQEKAVTPVFFAEKQRPIVQQLMSESKRQAAFNLAHRVQPQQVKSYQPYDLLGMSGGASSNISSSQRKVYQVSSTSTSASGQQCNVSSDVNAPAVVYIQPAAVRHVDASYDRHIQRPNKKRETYSKPRDSDSLDGEDDYSRPIRQSRSFLLIETALAVQGAGETGLPPPRSAAFEHEHAIQRRNQMQAEWL